MTSICEQWYLRTVEASGCRLATWAFDSDTIGPANKRAERLNLALAIPLMALVTEQLMLVDNGLAAPT